MTVIVCAASKLTPLVNAQVTASSISPALSMSGPFNWFLIVHPAAEYYQP
jgi:hypothetical protein